MSSRNQTAENIVDKTILVGISFADASGEVLSRTQFEGRILGLDETYGIQIETDEIPPFWLPPDLAALQPARPGEYRLRDSGRVVANPDFIAFYSVSAFDESQPHWEAVTGSRHCHWSPPCMPMTLNLIGKSPNSASARRRMFRREASRVELETAPRP